MFGAPAVRLARNGAFGGETVRLAMKQCVWRSSGAFGVQPLYLRMYLLSILLIRAWAGLYGPGQAAWAGPCGATVGQGRVGQAV